LEYHVEMFNKKRYNGWTTERLMRELGMSSVDEGVTLKMLIPIYKKYHIPDHCVDFKYHIRSSSNKHDYKPNCNYATLFYMIENNHLHPIEDKHMQNSLAHTQTKSCKMHHMRQREHIERKAHIFTHQKEILIMIGLAPHEPQFQQFNIKQFEYDIFVCTTPSVVHDLFHQCLKHGKLFT